MKKPRISADGARSAAVIVALVLLTLVLLISIVANALSSEGGPAGGAIAAVLALAFVALLLRIDVEKALRRIDRARAAAPVFAFVVVSSLMGNTPGTVKFDEIGAQVIVVLLLALAVDARFFRLRIERDRLDTVAAIFTMLVLASGEFYALNGLLTEAPRHAELIAGAIAAGFAAIAVAALAGPNRSTDSKQD